MDGARWELARTDSTFKEEETGIVIFGRRQRVISYSHCMRP